MNSQPTPDSSTVLTRRQFLSLLGVSSLSAFLAACMGNPPVTPPPTSMALATTPTASSVPSPIPTATAPPTPSSVPSPIPTATAPPTASPSPTARPTATRPPTATATPPFRALVAIGQAQSYEPRGLKRELEQLLGGIGGLSALVKSGARVGLKPNLTGGTQWDSAGKPPAPEYFVTHPAVVGALGELLLDLGASRLFIMDGLGDESNFQKWGYVDIAKPLGATLVNLCLPAPYADFKQFTVGPQAQIYDRFELNAVLGELDVFISVAKLKCHSEAGVTLSLKNLIGLAPISRYRRQAQDNNRNAFHDSIAVQTRLPRVILDLNRARPIDLALIDGIWTAEGGAGPWDQGLSPVRPGLLVAGRDPVAADAVATALMGLNPAAAAGTEPFLHADNHLALAHQSGLGTNVLSEIAIAGPAIQQVMYKFKPAS